MPIDWLTLGAALMSGLLGGAHCAAMCGGIATGFPAAAGRTSWRAALEPNAGRVLGYTLAGAIAGGLGQGIVEVARTDALAWGLRMAVGLVLVVVAIRLFDTRGRLHFGLGTGAALWQRLRPLQRHLLPANTPARRMGLGLLWGWMPCGLSTTLLAAAWFQADAGNGALTMAAFGLGTLPLMVPLTWSGARIGQRLQRSGWRSVGATLVLVAGLVTLAGPWLVSHEGIAPWLTALGCMPAA